MCAYIMPENCNPFMFSQFHISLMCFYTGRNEKKRQEHKDMADFYIAKMAENNQKYDTIWY